MSEDPEEFVQSVRSLVDEYRDRCLWFLRRDYVPETDDEILRTLEWIERYGDRHAFQEAARLRAWLSRISRKPSAA